MTIFQNPHSIWFWVVWAPLLLWQNYSFTLTSRARNSGSLLRHFFAAIQSNGVWFIAQVFTVGVFLKFIQGNFGVALAVMAAFFYTTFTIAGSLFSHWRALNKETGLNAVGANKRFVHITVEEWNKVKARVGMLPDVEDPVTALIPFKGIE